MKRLCLVCHVYQVFTRNGNSPSCICKDKIRYDQFPIGLFAQLVGHCTGIAKIMGSNPVQA